MTNLVLSQFKVEAQHLYGWTLTLYWSNVHVIDKSECDFNGWQCNVIRVYYYFRNCCSSIILFYALCCNVHKFCVTVQWLF